MGKSRRSLPRLVLPLGIFHVALLVACSSGPSSPLPSGDGNLAGGTPQGAPTQQPTSNPAPTSTTPAPPPSSTATAPVSDDAGAPGTPDASTVIDSGLGYFIDTSTGTPPTAPTGALGSCTNPACATDGNECGCQATDSNGDTVQLGCQAGGECVCVLNGNVDTQPFSENGACGTSQETAQQFLQFCTCQ
jgi:hypothetical protein